MCKEARTRAAADAIEILPCGHMVAHQAEVKTSRGISIFLMLVDRESLFLIPVKL